MDSGKVFRYTLEGATTTRLLDGQYGFIVQVLYVTYYKYMYILFSGFIIFLAWNLTDLPGFEIKFIALYILLIFNFANLHETWNQWTLCVIANLTFTHMHMYMHCRSHAWYVYIRNILMVT